jgi:hypothetical protein
VHAPDGTLVDTMSLVVESSEEAGENRKTSFEDLAAERAKCKCHPSAHWLRKRMHEQPSMTVVLESAMIQLWILALSLVATWTW